MKKILIIIILLITSMNVVKSGWNIIYSLSGVEFNSIFFININNGFCVGTNGIILKTTNAGLNWINTGFDTTGGYEYNDIIFIDNNTGYIAGYPGQLIKTTNTGLNWQKKTIGFNYTFSSIAFTNTTTGFISGNSFGSFNSGICLKTTNAGDSWYTTSFNNNPTLNDIKFINQQTGYIAGYLGGQFNYGILYKTSNGGNSWDSLLTFTIRTLFKSIYIADANNVFICGAKNVFYLTDDNPLIIKSSNAGMTWTEINTPANDGLNSITFINQNKTGFAVGYSGVILKSTNYGNEWFLQQSGIINKLNSVVFVDSLNGYICGNGIILKTTDGGGPPIGIEPISNNIPSEYKLYQNYPNPFNPVTSIKFDIPEMSQVRITIYDIRGRIIDKPVNERLNAGSYKIDWNGTQYPSGIYIYRIETDNFVLSRKMILVK